MRRSRNVEARTKSRQLRADDWHLPCTRGRYMPIDDGAGSTDDALVARALGGQTDAFETLVRRYNQRLFRAARSIVDSDGDAEAVMQIAYVHAYAHLAQYDKALAFSTWLTRIAIDAALNRASAARVARR